MYRDDKEALRDRVEVLLRELGMARAELEALQETLRVRNEQFKALMDDADTMRAALQGTGFDMRPLQKFVVGVTPVFMVVSTGLFIAGLLQVESGLAWLCGGMGVAFVAWVLRWLHTGKV
ncbi:MAG: hypothetical protein EVA89_14625 [Sandaracinaceae bacterium]|nr:MAG: hypothetical protein EVA89_14625 [Sandaracinaceae bacterium]